MKLIQVTTFEEFQAWQQTKFDLCKSNGLSGITYDAMYVTAEDGKAGYIDMFLRTGTTYFTYNFEHQDMNEYRAQASDKISKSMFELPSVGFYIIDNDI